MDTTKETLARTAKRKESYENPPIQRTSRTSKTKPFFQREKRIVQRQHSDATTTNEKRNDYDPISEKESRNGTKIVRITKDKTTKDKEKQNELTKPTCIICDNT
jgi:hypothetical protein